ncbi:hypothetical protein Y1Q_0023836 [Alligator mississippiensis]|uniref:Uncharacterized protein n=1 Tax=Alligator mississippiensis TaxID=8496 RepID=A0A151MKM0_ALLMI|nr:hypothetical protein Y1Q_0023836 [Alligator mississippiensis]
MNTNRELCSWLDYSENGNGLCNVLGPVFVDKCLCNAALSGVPPSHFPAASPAQTRCTGQIGGSRAGKQQACVSLGLFLKMKYDPSARKEPHSPQSSLVRSKQNFIRDYFRV